jgi:hypothetical protein
VTVSVCECVSEGVTFTSSRVHAAGLTNRTLLYIEDITIVTITIVTIIIVTITIIVTIIMSG